MGLYTAASKVPNLISMVSTVFFQAWNMSAITEHGNKGEGRFFGTVFSAYQSIMYIASAFLITLVQPVSKLLLNYNNHPEYAKAYLYTPVLILAVLMMCFNLFSAVFTPPRSIRKFLLDQHGFHGTKRSSEHYINKKFGVHGAVAASFISYVACYIIRVIDARRYIYFKVDHTKTVMNLSILLGMAIIAVHQPGFYIPLQIGITIFITAVNFPELMATVRKILKR